MKKLSIKISESIGSVSAEIVEVENMEAMLVLAHGAGAGMNHPFMVSLSKALAELGIGTLRYNFAYMENGKKRPDPPAIAERTVKEVIAKASSLFTDIPLFAGGKSFGGRMTSRCASQEAASDLSGLVFYGFPLHAAGQPSIDRADHLKQVKLPMLFLQGTRDALADLSLIKKVTASLKDTTLTVFEGADHSFKAGKKVFIPELAEATKSWVKSVLK